MESKKTIQSVAQEILDNLVTKERTDGTKFIAPENTIEWQQDIIRNAHLDRMPSDDIYERIYNILDRLSGLDDEAGEDEARDVIYEIEPDCYTSDLANWLSDNNNNVYYLTEALEQMEIKDGFQLLSAAQGLYIQEIANELINGIVKYIEETEE